jgi:microcystin-dependent protein
MVARATLANNAITTLALAITGTSDTTLSATSAAAFPALAGGNYFYATILDSENIPEVVKVTGISGTIFTIARAQDNTLARMFAVGAKLSMNLNAAVLNELLAKDLAGATGVLGISNGGTGAADAAAAQAALAVPSTTGAGASGTWGISISGSAATAATATDATNLTGTIASGVTATTQTAGDNSTKVATTAYIATEIASSPGQLPGEVCYFARSAAPTGFLKSNGALVSRATYAALFTAIGTTFGVGDGSTTFALPDLRGEFIRGWDDARGVDAGRVFGVAQTDALQGHIHWTNTYSYTNNFTAPGSIQGGGGSQLNTGSPITDGVNGTPRTGAETRPRNVALLACIKY